MYGESGTLAVIYSALSLVASSMDTMENGSIRDIYNTYAGPRGQLLATDIMIGV